MNSVDPSPARPSTRFEKERALQEAGVAVPTYPRAPSGEPQEDLQTTSDANLLAACDAWEFEIDRLYEQFLKLNHADDRL
jgi:hypothetical protein